MEMSKMLWPALNLVWLQPVSWILLFVLAGLAPTNEDVIRVIAAQLAEIGDQFDKEIKGRVVNDLVQHFLNERLSKEVSEQQPGEQFSF